MTLWSERLAAVQRLAFDTSALIYALEGVGPYASLVAAVLARMQQSEVYGVVSAVVEVELLVKPLREGSQREIHQVEYLLQETPNLAVRPVDRTVARRAAEVRARTRLPLSDAIIVATALEERCDVLIGNDAKMASRVAGIHYLYLDEYV